LYISFDFNFTSSHVVDEDDDDVHIVLAKLPEFVY
jgi:hypothetical protein